MGERRGVYPSVGDRRISSQAPQQSSGPLTGWVVTGPLPEAGHWQVLPGDWKVHFTYQNGDALMIEKVEMLENGNSVAVDEHLAPAGPDYDNNEFRFHISKVNPASKYSLRAMVHGLGGNESSGYITISPPSP